MEHQNISCKGTHSLTHPSGQMTGKQNRDRLTVIQVTWSCKAFKLPLSWIGTWQQNPPPVQVGKIGIQYIIWCPRKFKLYSQTKTIMDHIHRGHFKDHLVHFIDHSVHKAIHAASTEDSLLKIEENFFLIDSSLG
jgi:hypothetical protein